MANEISKHLFKPPKKKEHLVTAIKRTRQVTFLEAFAQVGVVSLACKAAGINQVTERQWRNSGDKWYADCFKIALQTYRDSIEHEVHRRAVYGEKSPIIGRVQKKVGTDIDGNPIFAAEDAQLKDENGNPMFRVTKSDLLLMFHAKKVLPEYREDYEAKDDGPRIDAGDSPMTRITFKIDMIRDRQNAQIGQRRPLGLPEAPDVIDAEITNASSD